MRRSFRIPKKVQPRPEPPIEGKQLTMFGSRQANGPTVSHGGDRTIWSSTTWMFRRLLMDDFMVRSACRNKPFKRRCTWNEQDTDGDTLSWVTKYEKRAGDVEHRHYHVRGPDGQHLKEKWHGNHALRLGTKTPKIGGYGPIVRHYDPPHEEFPSHSCSTFFPGRYVVTGDDGTTWEIGSRGNDDDVLRQEVINNPELWPDEKEEMLRWLDGPRKLVPDPASRFPVHEQEQHLDSILRWVDSYFCQRIQRGIPTTAEEIEASGLPDKYVENLVYNLRNYVPIKPYVDEGVAPSTPTG